jgi:hypothetical protein
MMTKEAAEIGVMVEEMFIRETFTMRDLGKFPPWLHFFCAATDFEDEEGIDAWAYTVVGKIPLQIKAGKKRRDDFSKRENRKHIPCVVVPPYCAFEDVFTEVLAVLLPEYDTLVKSRTNMS